MQIGDAKRINQIGNIALVERSDNVPVRDDAPAKYGQRTRRTRALPIDRLATQLAQHGLPNVWQHMELEQFLSARNYLTGGRRSQAQRPPARSCR